MFNKVFAGCEMINCSIDCLGVSSNCRKMSKLTGDEETDLCAMLNKISTNILVIYNHVHKRLTSKAKLKQSINRSLNNQ